MPLLTREAMLAPATLPRELVDLRPHLDGEVYVRTLTAAERDRFEADNTRVRGKGSRREIEPNLANYRARLAVLVCCDATGKRLFSDDDAADLGRQSAAALDRIVDVAHRLNGMREDAVEDAEKNSATSRNGSSSSALLAR